MMMQADQARGRDIENGYFTAPIFGRFYLPLAGKRTRTSMMLIRR